jgi:hypothetical protein
MLSLGELQSQLATNLLDPGAEEAMRVTVNAIPAQERIDFHRNSGVFNFRGTLRAVYPVVERLVGVNFFACAADAYRDAQPSTSSDLNLFGEHFADFVDTWTATGEFPYLADIARLEWRIEQSFQAPDRASLSVHDFAAVPPERHEKLKFKLHPSCRLLASEWPIHHIWQANQPGAPVGITLDLRKRNVYLLIRRQARAVVIETVDRGDFCMLNLLATGSVFDDAGRSAIATEPDFDLVAFLQKHVAAGVFAEFGRRRDETMVIATRSPGEPARRRSDQAFGEE